jgi:hypothetical protein
MKNKYGKIPIHFQPQLLYEQQFPHIFAPNNINCPITNDYSELSNKIVEMIYDINTKQWMAVKFRPDKQEYYFLGKEYGNSIMIAE